MGVFSHVLQQEKEDRFRKKYYTYRLLTTIETVDSYLGTMIYRFVARQNQRAVYPIHAHQ